MATSPLALPDASKPFLERSALEQASLVRDGALTSQVLVAAYLERIARHDASLGAFVSVIADRAMRDAARADRHRAAGRPMGPFHGVPTAVKDLHLMRGMPVKFGSRAFKWLWSPVDDPLVRSIRGAGFVLLGKTSTSELGLLPIVETDLHPPTRNPWNTAHTAGGSSGGAGAAVAAGLVPIAPGSDGAGSVRIPASLNGLVGIKASRGLMAANAPKIDTFRMTANGPLARNVNDAAALLDVITGRLPDAPGSFLSQSRTPPRRLKIGLLIDPPVGDALPAIAAVVRRAAALFRDAGHTVIELPRLLGTVDEFLPIYQAFFAGMPILAPSKLQAVTRWFREQGRKLPSGAAEAAFASLAARGVQAMGDCDVMLTPTVPILPPKVGAFAGLPPRELFLAVAPLGAFTAVSNVTGFPALSVPAGRVEGFPVGVQLIGRPDTDGELFALARVVEAAGVGTLTP